MAVVPQVPHHAGQPVTHDAIAIVTATGFTTAAKWSAP